jgi:hypothetical protein
VSTEEGRLALRSKFWVERRWFDWSPSSSKKVSAAIALQEHQRHSNEIKDMTLQVKAALRMGLKNLIDHLVERLTPHATGRKRFAATTITKVVEFLELFSARNVCGDRELAILADEAKAVLDGQTPDSIRDDEAVQEMVVKRMSDVKTGLDKLLEDMPERLLIVDDEDDE